MPAAKKATARPKRKIVSPAETRTQLRLTVDSKFTKSHFSQLFAVLKIRRKNALAEHIIMSFKSKAAQAQLVAFYNFHTGRAHFKTCGHDLPTISAIADVSQYGPP
jgi:hypothetical protein